MTGFPNSPRLVKGGIVLMDARSGVVRRVIAMQYNPDTLTRTLQVQGVDGGGGGGGDRSEALRIKGPPIETLKLDAEIDATDQLEFPEQYPDTAKLGIQPQLAALEVIAYPPSERLQANNALAAAGTLEVAPVEAPLMLFVWSRRRIVPVRLTDFSITEEAFDPQLNPIRAKVSLGMRVLSVADLGFDHRGGSLYMTYHREKERLAAGNAGAALGALGINAI